MKTSISQFIFIAFIVVACSSKKRVADSAAATAPNLVEARVIWVKDKGNKFDFNLSITNLSDKGIIIYLSDLGCSKGGVAGELKHTFFNTGERTIDFKGGQAKKFNMVCRLPTKVAAKNMNITVKKISEDRDNDGRVGGKVLYRDLTIPIAL